MTFTRLPFFQYFFRFQGYLESKKSDELNEITVSRGVFKPVFSKTGFFEGFWTLEKTKKMAKNVLNFGAIGANKG